MAGLTAEEARAWAEDWIGAWNEGGVEDVVRRYRPGAEVVLLSAADGEVAPRSVTDRDDLRELVDARQGAGRPFVVEDVYTGAQSLVVTYRWADGTRAAEVVELDEEDRVVRAAVHEALGAG